MQASKNTGSHQFETDGRVVFPVFGKRARWTVGAKPARDDLTAARGLIVGLGLGILVWALIIGAVLA